MCVFVCVSLSVSLSVTALAGTTGTRRVELRYLQKALDVGNKTNVGFQLKTFSLRVMETFTHGENIDR